MHTKKRTERLRYWVKITKNNLKEEKKIYKCVAFKVKKNYFQCLASKKDSEQMQ